MAQRQRRRAVLAHGAHRHLAEDGRERVLEGGEGRLAAGRSPAEDARGADAPAVRRRQRDLLLGPVRGQRRARELESELQRAEVPLHERVVRAVAGRRVQQVAALDGSTPLVLGAHQARAIAPRGERGAV